ncbi:hypothetical protein BHU61_02870 [Macrococcus epidermidis]|uniref:Uncharacterized protein n=1 Tax=Macrococcus epidermidis TaxID=1902580 RepID=A0A327ZVS0_9STAP|nr:hypothetical protein BHU61_02870 [Macrococcus epidermidis]
MPLLLYTFSGISLLIPSIPLLLTTFSGISLFIPSIPLLLTTFSGISLFIPSIPLNLCQQIKKDQPFTRDWSKTYYTNFQISVAYCWIVLSLENCPDFRIFIKLI